MKVIAYTRVSTDEQVDSGLGLAAQRTAILAEAERRGWDEVEFIEDAGYSAKDLQRPGIQAAMDALKHHRADVLVVSKLDRLSRSLIDFAGLMDQATRQHWALVSLDIGFDTGTPSGRAMASMMAVFSQLERELIGQRTRDALRALQARGVRLGRPRQLPGAVAARIAESRRAGATLQAIADELNADGIATAQGGAKWRPSSVRSVLHYTSAEK